MTTGATVMLNGSGDWMGPRSLLSHSNYGDDR